MGKEQLRGTDGQLTDFGNNRRNWDYGEEFSPHHPTHSERFKTVLTDDGEQRFALSTATGEWVRVGMPAEVTQGVRRSDSPENGNMFSGGPFPKVEKYLEKANALNPVLGSETPYDEGSKEHALPEDVEAKSADRFHTDVVLTQGQADVVDTQSVSVNGLPK